MASPLVKYGGSPPQSVFSSHSLVAPSQWCLCGLSTIAADPLDTLVHAATRARRGRRDAAAEVGNCHSPLIGSDGVLFECLSAVPRWRDRVLACHQTSLCCGRGRVDAATAKRRSSGRTTART